MCLPKEYWPTIQTPTAMLVGHLGYGPESWQSDIQSDGSFAYAPNAGFLGNELFTYKANDGALDSAAATVTIAVTTDPALRTGTVSGVSNQGWTKVSLDHGYESMVVVLSPSYAAGGVPLIGRVRNAVGNNFEVRVDRADGSTAPVSGVTVHYTAVEEGVYTLAEHGVKMEAVKFTSSRTDTKKLLGGPATELLQHVHESRRRGAGDDSQRRRCLCVLGTRRIQLRIRRRAANCMSASMWASTATRRVPTK